jgi:HK97 family phage major capsid protein
MDWPAKKSRRKARWIMGWQEIKALKERRGQVLKDMRAILDAAQAGNRDLTDQENRSFDGLNQLGEELAGQIDRATTLYGAETRDGDTIIPRGPIASAHPGDQFGFETQGDSALVFDQRNAHLVAAEFRAWMAGTPMTPEVKKFHETRVAALDDELRAMSIAGNGGATVPLGSVGNIEVATLYTGSVLAAARILPTTTGAPIVFPVFDDTANSATEQTAEGDDVTSTGDPTISGVTLGAYTFGTGPLTVSTSTLQDTAVPFEQEIYSAGVTRGIRKANVHLTTGTGTGQPQGIVTASTLGVTAAATNAITYDEVVSLVHSVDPSYRANPGFGLMMHDLTFAAIRKLKDSAGRYIFSAGENGAPETILGYRYFINNDMAQLSSGVSSKVMLAGDFNRFLVRNVAAMTWIRDPYTLATRNQVQFTGFMRVDSKLLIPSAVKHLKLAAA